MELANRPLIREQAFGEALDPYKLERLGRYEVHLDRKLERMLAMLLRLKDLRQGTVDELIRLAKCSCQEAALTRRAHHRGDEPLEGCKRRRADQPRRAPER